MLVEHIRIPLPSGVARNDGFALELLQLQRGPLGQPMRSGHNSGKPFNTENQSPEIRRNRRVHIKNEPDIYLTFLHFFNLFKRAGETYVNLYLRVFGPKVFQHVGQSTQDRKIHVI
ncbi:hypothetical protein RUM4293_03507 [Ruegeria atlantica]|uniref:Uncharacterized protein n=1 Tax=Ruegeria atlantica TaxID=81569 RepID=A0A0P1E8I4_9RHOB|nr:hypothetical protein RUM4293_03507 [Ruegeria atlantica]